MLWLSVAVGGMVATAFGLWASRWIPCTSTEQRVIRSSWVLLIGEVTAWLLYGGPLTDGFVHPARFWLTGILWLVWAGVSGCTLDGRP